jgi:cardiolipin synthase A/B
MNLDQYLKGNAQARNNRIRLVHSGSEFFDLLLKLINEATDSIHLQTYIFDGDETGKRVGEALMAAAKRKVQVLVLADGFASRSLPQSLITAFNEAGVQFRFFEPLFRSKNFYFGRRLHHKVVVVDTRFALVGGINISDKYNDMPQTQAWLDFALLAEGDIARQLCVLCWKTWKGFPAGRAGRTIYPCFQKEIPGPFPESDKCLVYMRRNDWVRRKNEISRSYNSMLKKAKSDVFILSSYFLPGKIFRLNLKKAVRRGISVKIIIAGRSDVPLSKNAERYWYDWLIRNQIEIYEYNKNILHGKLAVCDGKLLTLGSFNINDISAYASVELNLEVLYPALAASTETLLEGIALNDCVRITQEQFSHSRSIIQRFIRWVSYQTFQIIFTLFTFYFRHQE